jgi:hypothetical protein
MRKNGEKRFTISPAKAGHYLFFTFQFFTFQEVSPC